MARSDWIAFVQPCVYSFGRVRMTQVRVGVLVRLSLSMSNAVCSSVSQRHLTLFLMSLAIGWTFVGKFDTKQRYQGALPRHHLSSFEEVGGRRSLIAATLSGSIWMSSLPIMRPRHSSFLIKNDHFSLLICMLAALSLRNTSRRFRVCSVQ